MAKYSVAKKVLINADPQTVYDRVADYGTWTTWSPWLCAEPDAEVTVSDDPRSVGSRYAWSGDIVGAGELEHEVLEPGKSIRDEIRFLRPMKSVSKVGFDFVAKDGGTEVTWSMSGSLPFFLFWMTGSIETFVGMDYTRGLKMLKEWIETGDIKSKTSIVGPQAMGPFSVLGTRAQCEMKNTGPSMEQSFAKTFELLQRAGMETCGEKITVYHDFDLKKQTFDYTSGVLFAEAPASVPEGLNSWSLPSVQAFRVDHVGAYEHLGNAWSAANQHVRSKKMKQSKVGTFELYKNDPSETAPEDLLTEIYLPLK